MTAGDGFAPDPRLAADSHLVADGPLSQLRLMDDTRFAWLVLVPRRPGATEWVDLDGGAQRLLLAEVNRAAALLRATGPCDKLNVGALGNIVRQLHVHVVARTEGDAAWPGPVWGSGPMVRFAPQALADRVRQLREALARIDTQETT
jgi:diadenosine tetraphosphate (Ap4A) HIT family hydrolase